jgi:hypothetical protein
VIMISVDIKHPNVMSAEYIFHDEGDAYMEVITDLPLDEDGESSLKFKEMNVAVEEQRLALPLHRRGKFIRYKRR